MNSSQRHSFHPLFTIALLVLGLFALAMAQNKPARSAQPANAVDQILSGQGQAMISQPVTLSNVAVQNLTQNDIVWVGADRAHSVLVMLQPSVNPIGRSGNPTPIARGDQVRVTGHVLRAPSTQVLDGWGLSPADAGRVQRQGVVVQAVTFEVLAHAH
jgi:hypothetical protein